VFIKILRPKAVVLQDVRVHHSPAFVTSVFSPSPGTGQLVKKEFYAIISSMIALEHLLPLWKRGSVGYLLIQ